MRQSLAGLILAWLALFQAAEAHARCGDPPNCADLHLISGVGIIVERSGSGAPLGLTDESARQAVAAALRSHIPRLKTKESGFPFLHVRIFTLSLPIAVGGRGFTYAYALSVHLKAPATLSHNSQPAIVASWAESAEGLGYSAKELERALENIIQSFVSDWSKANPDGAPTEKAVSKGLLTRAPFN